MSDIFYNPAAFKPLERAVKVQYALSGDAANVVREFTIDATVVQGGNLSNGAGAPIASETGDRLSVVVRAECWPMEEPPSVGMRFVFPEPMGTYTCKTVQTWRWGWTLRCTHNMRGGQVL